jgi:methylenetetrahydrofolate reductase (NADPH)
MQQPMRIDSLLAARRPVFSFEFFPPDDDAATERLFATIASLREDCQPDFVSVTCRNHSRQSTLRLVERIKRDLGIEAMAHFTCAGATEDELHELLAAVCERGIDNVLALRGDPPKDSDTFVPVAGGLAHATDLAELIRDSYDLCVGAACYPEVHTESPDGDHDMTHTVHKVEAGATFLITQLFFDNRAYFDFVARARAAGITVPIIPGIMPITSVKQLSRFAGKLFGAHIPQALADALVRRADDPDAIVQLGAAYATLQCSELLAAGAPGIHFYTLNRSPATRAILAALLAAQPWERPR